MMDIETRKVAIKLLSASKDAAREARFECGSRRRKAAIAQAAAPLVEAAGDADLASLLHRLAAKLAVTACWGSAPRQGLSEAFGRAARLLHPDVESDLRHVQVAATRKSAQALEDVFAGLLGRSFPGR